MGVAVPERRGGLGAKPWEKGENIGSTAETHGNKMENTWGKNMKNMENTTWGEKNMGSRAPKRPFFQI